MANVVEGADVRMIQAGNCFGFALEALAQFSTIGKMRGQNLDGDDPVQTGIFGAVNLTHPSGANIREDFVRAPTFARKDRHGLLLTWNRGEYNAVKLKKAVFFSWELIQHYRSICSPLALPPLLNAIPFCQKISFSANWISLLEVDVESNAPAPPTADPS